MSRYWFVARSLFILVSTMCWLAPANAFCSAEASALSIEGPAKDFKLINLPVGAAQLRSEAQSFALGDADSYASVRSVLRFASQGQKLAIGDGFARAAMSCRGAVYRRIGEFVHSTADSVFIAAYNNALADLDTTPHAAAIALEASSRPADGKRPHVGGSPEREIFNPWESLPLPGEPISLSK